MGGQECQSEIGKVGATSKMKNNNIKGEQRAT